MRLRLRTRVLVALLLLAILSIVWWTRPSPSPSAPSAPEVGDSPPALGKPGERVRFVDRDVSRTATSEPLTGRVVDALDGEPVAEAVIESVAVDGSVMASVKPARDGRFTLDRARLGSHLTVVAVGYAQERVAQPRFPITVRLRPLTKVHGHVLAPNLRPAPQVAVECRPAMSVRSHDQVLTDSSGNFELNSCGAGKAEIRASHPSFGVIVHSLGEVLPGEEKKVEIVLKAPAQISGSVRRSDGSPAVPCTVSASPVTEDFTLLGLANCSEDGAFDLGLVSGLPVRIVAYDSAGRSAMVEHHDASHPVSLTLPDWQEIAGRVESGGSPVRGARVQIQREPGGKMIESAWFRDGTHIARGLGMFLRALVTDGDGRFSFDGLEDGLYRIDVRATGFAPVSKVVMAGTTDALIELAQQPSAVRGRLIDRDGAISLHRAVVRLCDLSPDREPTVTVVGTTSGAFEIGPVAAGDYEVGAAVAGASPAERVRFSLPSGQTAEVDLIVSNAVEVHGTVRSIDGFPVVGARIGVPQPACFLGDDIWTQPTFDGSYVLTGQDGHFSLRGPSEGKLFVFRPEFQSQLLDYEDAANIEVTLTPGVAEDFIETDAHR